MIRVALIGVSGYGRCYMDALRALTPQGKVKLVAACIVNRTEERERWDQLSAQGVRCFEESAAMWRTMRGHVDLTLVPTPPHTHVPLAIEAFSAGSHVLIEKPMAPCVAEAKTMMDAASGSGRQLFVGFQDLYAAGNWQLKRELVTGVYGKVRSISFLGLWPRPVSYYSRNAWAGREKVGKRLVNDTPVSNAFAHFLNLCLFFAGPAEPASAGALEIEAELFRANDIETFDTAAIRIRTDTGIPVHFFCSHACEQEAAPTIRIASDSATILWKNDDGILLKSNGAEEFREMPGGLDTRIAMLGNIATVLNGEPAVICTPDIAMAPLVVSERLMAAPVQPFSPKRARRKPLPEDSLMTVEGLSDTLHACHEAGLLPGELAGRPVWSEHGRISSVP